MWIEKTGFFFFFFLFSFFLLYFYPAFLPFLFEIEKEFGMANREEFPLPEEDFDVVVLGTGLKECILSGLLSVAGMKVTKNLPPKKEKIFHFDKIMKKKMYFIL